MIRPVALLAAVLCAGLAVSSACATQAMDGVHFTLDSERGGNGRIRASFREDREGRDHNNWSTGFMPSDLIGLEVSSFRGPATRPLHFAIVREAGRLDCSGNGGGEHANGTCRFAADPGFTQLLASRGIGSPTPRQAFGLMAVNARREMIDAVAAARYPTPTIDNLTALAALGVDGRYVGEMARAGYRPNSIQRLIEFKALGITPQWIAGFVGIGYANLPGDGLVQMRALGITPEFITGYERIGYRRLPVDTLVQLKALGITPDFVRRAVPAGAPLPSVAHLEELRMFSDRH
jgi:hypothetical protein